MPINASASLTGSKGCLTPRDLLRGTIYTCSRISAGASRVPLHLGYLLQPRKYPRRLPRNFIGAPHSGQVSFTSTSGTAFLAGGGINSLIVSFNSGGIGLVLRHLG